MRCVGGMGSLPISLGMIRDTFHPTLMPLGVAIITAMFSVGMTAGLVVGGGIVQVFQHSEGWRYCFYIVTPLVAVLWMACGNDGQSGISGKSVEKRRKWVEIGGQRVENV